MAMIVVDVVSAESSVFSGEAKFVVLPGQEGELGVLPGHAPLITRICPGMVRVHTTEGKEESIFVAGGLLEVQPDRVTVLADVAVRSEDLDEAKAKQAIDAAKQARENAKSEINIAKVQAKLSALSAELQFIKKLRQEK